MNEFFQTLMLMPRFLLMLAMVALLQPLASSFIVKAKPLLLPQPEGAAAAIEDERGLLALDQTLRELANPFSVMFIATAPNDVDEGALAYLRRKLGARVVIVFATRGEGRDSTVASETGKMLSVTRTREALQLTRALGADAFFLNLADFGYSKSANEALRTWGRDNALSKLVRAIRVTRPDCILTKASGQSANGQQQALWRLLSEAFDAAGNTKMAPEADAEVWQVRRLFRQTDESPADLRLNLAEVDALRGRSYAELGLIAHQQLTSLGGSKVALTPDRLTSQYKLALSAADESVKIFESPTSGILLPEKVRVGVAPPRVGDLTLLEAIGQRDHMITALTERLIEKRAEGGADAQHERYGADYSRVIRYTQTLERALALALGLSLEVNVSDPVIIQGQQLGLRATLHNSGEQARPAIFHTPEQLVFNKTNGAFTASEPAQAPAGGTLTHEATYDTKAAPLTLPRDTHLSDEEFYPIGSTLPGAQPLEPFGHRLLITAEVALDQVTIPLTAQARFNVAPAVEIATAPFALIKDWETPRDVECPVRLRNRTPGALSGALWVVPLAVNDESYEPAHIAFTHEDEEIMVNLRLHLPILKPPLAPDLLLEFRREKPAPPVPLGTATIAVKPMDFAVVDGLRVGILSGPDSSLAFALKQLGVTYEEVTPDRVGLIVHGNPVDKNLTSGCDKLKRFDTIIVDQYAYAAHPGLVALNPCLLRYAQAGGNLVVLGQQAGDFNLLRAPFAPFALAIAPDRLTIESAAVKILDSAHPLMTKPNAITSSDFDGWIEERAAFVPRTWADDYLALLETSDPGEEASRGTLLVARTGEGWFVFTTLSLNHQWMNGVPGAYRLLANLVSLPKVGKPQIIPQTNPQ